MLGLKFTVIARQQDASTSLEIDKGGTNVQNHLGLNMNNHAVQLQFAKPFWRRAVIAFDTCPHIVGLNNGADALEKKLHVKQSSFIFSLHWSAFLISLLATTITTL